MFRATTSSADTFDRSVVMSSLMPSLKYSCSASPLMFENGSTQMEVFWLLGFVACIGAIGLPVSSATLAEASATLGDRRRPPSR